MESVTPKKNNKSIKMFDKKIPLNLNMFMYAESILERNNFWNTLINCKLASATNGGGYPDTKWTYPKLNISKTEHVHQPNISRSETEGVALTWKIITWLVGAVVDSPDCPMAVKLVRLG